MQLKTNDHLDKNLSAISELSSYSQVIKHFSSTFSEFYRIFPDNKQPAVEIIYSFLRIFDTLIDYRGAKTEIFDELKIRTLKSAKSLEENKITFTGIPFIDDTIKLAKKYDFRYKEFKAFLDSMEMDIDYSYSASENQSNKKRINLNVQNNIFTVYPTMDKSTEGESDFGKYIEGSAGIVGIWLAKILLFDEEKNQKYGHLDDLTELEEVLIGAQLMGDLFQIVNFLRDMNRDLGLVYSQSVKYSAGKARDELELQARLYVPPLEFIPSTRVDKYDSLLEEYESRKQLSETPGKGEEFNPDSWLKEELITVINNSDDSNRIYFGILKVIQTLEEDYLPCVESALTRLPRIPQLAVSETLKSYRKNVLEKLKKQPELALKVGESTLKPGKISIFFGIFFDLLKMLITPGLKGKGELINKISQLTVRFWQKLLFSIIRLQKNNKISDKIGYYAMFFEKEDIQEIDSTILSDQEIQEILTVQNKFRS